MWAKDTEHSRANAQLQLRRIDNRHDILALVIERFVWIRILSVRTLRVASSGFQKYTLCQF
jgi:hypothetical protein